MSEEQPRKLKVCVIKEEYLSLTGDAISAAVLNQMIFWAEFTNKSDQKIRDEIEAYKKIGNLHEVNELKKQIRNGWFWKAASEMAEEIMISTRQTVARRLDKLVEMKFLDSRPNPDPNFVTKYYRVNLAYIQSELHKKGFSLEGYTLPSNNISTSGIDQNEQYQMYGVAQNEQGVSQGEQGVAQNEQGVAQNEQVSSYQSLGSQSLGSQSLEEEDPPPHLPGAIDARFIQHDINRLVKLYPQYSKITEEIAAEAIKNRRAISPEEDYFLEQASAVPVHEKTLEDIYQTIRGELGRTARSVPSFKLIESVFQKFSLNLQRGNIKFDQASWFKTTWFNERITEEQASMIK